MSAIFKRKDFREECDSIVNMIYEEKYGRAQNYLSQFFNLNLENLYEVGKEEGYKIIYPILGKEYEDSEAAVMGFTTLGYCISKKIWGITALIGEIIGIIALVISWK